MASSSGTYSGSSLIQNSGSEEDLQQQMDQRKRKRMISNRESARRSRIRKQKHLDDLMTQVTQLRTEKNQIISRMNVTTQHYIQFEDENSILRAQVGELSHRLESLNEIISFLDVNNGGFGNEEVYNSVTDQTNDGLFMNNNNIWNDLYMNQPILASAELLQF